MGACRPLPLAPGRARPEGAGVSGASTLGPEPGRLPDDRTVGLQASVTNGRLSVEQLKWHEPAAYLRARARADGGSAKPWSPIWLALLITVGLFALFRGSEFVRGTPSKMG